MDKLNRRVYYITAIVLSAALLGTGIYLLGHDVSSWGGVCIGLGAAVIGLSVGSLFMYEMEKRRQEIRHAKVIERNDERLAFVRSKAGAITNRIITWLLFVVALVFAGLEVKLFVVLVIASLILVSGIINLIFTIHYNRKY